MGSPIENVPTEPLGEARRAVAPGRSFPIGTRIAERYVLSRFVAAGGFGEVYEARDLELGGVVALKMLRSGLAEDPEALARFRREIQVARSVTHPNVCRVFDLGIHEGPPRTPFLTMELVRGTSLADRLHEGPLDRAQAREVLAQIVAGLAAAHRADVVHRDLKPANIMIDAAGRVAITDFGLAIARAEQASSAEPAEGGGTETRTAGTPAYMAPEVLAGGPPTTASDLYALGVVMYELQVGRLPRTIGAAREVDPRIFEAPLSLDGARWHDRAWEAAMRRCLAAAPGDRPRDALDVLPPAASKRWLAFAGVGVAGLAAITVVAWPSGTPRPSAAAIRPPADARAAEAYAAGMQEMRELDLPAARAHLREAAAQAPLDAVTLAQLAAVETLAGDPTAARVAAGRAQLALIVEPGHWTAAERLLVEARGHEARGEWRRALASWSALVPMTSDLDHRLAIVRAHVALADVASARAELDAIRPAAGSDAVFVDLAATTVMDRANDFPRELELGRAVVAAARTRSSPILAAHGHLAIATAAVYLGDAATFAASIDAAEAGFAARDHQLGLAEATRVRSMSAWMKGDFAKAYELGQRALERSTRAGDLRGRANSLGALSLLANRLGDFETAIRHAEAARAAYTVLADQRQIAWAFEQLGNIAYMRDEIAKARDTWLQALAVADAANDRVRAGDLAFNLGEASLLLGDLGAARLYNDQALAHYRATENRRGLAETELQVAELLVVRDELDGALEHLRRARAGWQANDQASRLPAAAVLEARIALSRDQPQQALAVIHPAADAPELEPGLAFDLAILEATAALVARDLPRARAAHARAAKAYQEPPASASRLLVAIRAWLAAAEGNRSLAIAEVAGLRARLPATQPFGARAELELVLVRAERAAGVASDASARLAGEAADRGYVRVARLARALAR